MILYVFIVFIVVQHTVDQWWTIKAVLLRLDQHLWAICTWAFFCSIACSAARKVERSTSFALLRVACLPVTREFTVVVMDRSHSFGQAFPNFPVILVHSISYWVRWALVSITEQQTSFIMAADGRVGSQLQHHPGIAQSFCCSTSVCSYNGVVESKKETERDRKS